METTHVQNVATYDLYPNITLVEKNDDEIKNALLEIRELCISHLSPLLVDYIWQSDSFNLTPVSPIASADCPAHLHGVTDFGDNIEDEWFIVYLLYELTDAIPGLVASIQDSDGEFLLIEAAYHLPKWLEPETSTNRIFIHDGDLHVIPKPNTPAEITMFPAGVPSKSRSVETIRCHAQQTLAAKPIRKTVKARVNGFPEKVKTNFHHANCLLPAKLASILNQRPSLVAPAVDAFIQRDPIDLKACRVMKNFPPENLVKARVKFTRCLYAQLVQQRFQADRRSGWKLPPPASQQFTPADLGMKLAHGFEILCTHCQGNKREVNGTSSLTPDPNDLAQGARWEKFLASLKDKGYFRGELEGSKLYRELLASAKRFYAESLVANPNSQQQSSHMAGHTVLALLQTVPCDVQQLRIEAKKLPPPDSDKWMEITQEELDGMIAKASGKASELLPSGKLAPPRKQQTHSNNDVTFDPSQVTESLKSFVDTVSGLKGVEFPVEEGDIKFDAEEFEKALRNILDFRESTSAMEDSDSDLMSDRDYQSGDDEDGEEGEDADANLAYGASGCHDDEIRALMEQMDRELATTEIGKSFERETSADNLQKKTKMDQSGTANGMDTSGPVHSQLGEKRMTAEEGGEEDEDSYRPVEVDVNLLKNILESYSSQQGLSGPASNILHSMGIHVPLNADGDDDDDEDDR